MCVLYKCRNVCAQKATGSFVDQVVTVVTPGGEGRIEKGGINGDLVCYFVSFYGLNIFYEIFMRLHHINLLMLNHFGLQK